MLAGAALAGCTSPQSSPSSAAACPDDWSLEEHPEEGFELCRPDTWTVREDLFGADVVAYPGGEVGEFGANVLVKTTQAPRAESLDRVVDANERTLERGITGYEKVSEAETSLGERRAHRLTFTGVQGEYDLQWRQTYALHEGTLYILGYTATQDGFGENLDDVRAIEDSFRLR